MQTSLSYLLERVRVRREELQPVLGAPDDTAEMHALAVLRAQKQVLRETCMHLEATGTDYLPTQVVLAVLDAS